MSGGELLLTLVVALFVFGPKKLPMLAYHLCKMFAHINRYKQQAVVFWQQQINQQQLQENLKKAEQADVNYHQEL
jgi:sec-independent protein translocase protein TatB